MTTQDKWQILVEMYEQRRRNRKVPTAVPSVQLRNRGVADADIKEWQQRGIVTVMRSINDNLIKPIKL